MAQHNRIACQVASKNRRWLAAGQCAGDFFDLRIESQEHRVALRQFRLLDLSLAVEQRQRRDLQFAAGQHGQVEVQRRPLEVHFEAVRERPPLLVDDAAGRRNDERLVGELKLAHAVFDRLAAHTPLARHRRGHSEKQADEMSIVDSQIDERAADLRRVVKVLDPERIGNDSLEMAPEQFAILAANNRLAGECVFGQQWQHLPHQHLAFGFVAGPHDAVTFRRGQAHRLFDEHMLARQPTR